MGDMGRAIGANTVYGHGRREGAEEASGRRLPDRDEMMLGGRPGSTPYRFFDLGRIT